MTKKTKKQLLEAIEYLQEHATAYVISAIAYKETDYLRKVRMIENRAEWLKELVNEVKL